MKILGIVLGVLMIASVSYAEGLSDLLDGLPDIKQGVAYDFVGGDGNLLSLTSVDVVRYKIHDVEKVSIGAGWLSDLDDLNMPAATLSYKIGGLEDLGFTYPLAEFVRPELGVFAAKRFDGENNWMLGVQASIIKVKF